MTIPNLPMTEDRGSDNEGSPFFNTRVTYVEKNSFIPDDIASIVGDLSDHTGKGKDKS